LVNLILLQKGSKPSAGKKTWQL